MVRFKSIMSRIIFLHVIAVIVTAIFMPLALYWFMNSAASNLHHEAMREQAELIARYLQSGSDGHWALDLPRGLRDLYSEAYGRYAYAVLDDSGQVLFSSRNDQKPVFPADPRSAGVQVFETERGGKMISWWCLSADAKG